ncbi:hypothetical protein ACKVMT_16355 [Halobacteriales archaeon Cl-PHB]
MSSDEDLSDLPLPQRVALLTVAHCARTQGGPVHTGQVVQACGTRMDALGEEALGRIGEAEVSRALNRLEADGYVQMEVKDESATGKGRPVYSLTMDAETVVDAFRPDKQLNALIEAYADAWS